MLQIGTTRSVPKKDARVSFLIPERKKPDEMKAFGF
jgi:hypothetical protein